MKLTAIESAIESILFASGEPVPARRIAAILDIDTDTLFDIAQKMQDDYESNGRGIRLRRLEDSLQLCSTPENSEVIRKVLETRKPPQLSQSAMEVLAIIAYYQPATRAYVEEVRGVDSSYTVNSLCEKGLIEPCGKLSVPGRPVIYRTTPDFLRVFGISSLKDLPEIPDIAVNEEEQLRMEDAIEALRKAEESAEMFTPGDTSATME